LNPLRKLATKSGVLVNAHVQFTDASVKVSFRIVDPTPRLFAQLPAQLLWHAQLTNGRRSMQLGPALFAYIPEQVLAQFNDHYALGS